MCQGLTKAGKPCTRRGDGFCFQHQPGDEVPRTNLAAFEDLIRQLTEHDALLVPQAAVQLGRTLAADMDLGQVIVCDCGERHSTGRNAALVKQYRELLGEVAADGIDETRDIWAEFATVTGS